MEEDLLDTLLLQVHHSDLSPQVCSEQLDQAINTNKQNISNYALSSKQQQSQQGGKAFAAYPRQLGRAVDLKQACDGLGLALLDPEGLRCRRATF